MIRTRCDEVVLQDDAPAEQDIRALVVEGLRATPKRLPCQLFYDAHGSALFERICELPEYYLTRTELRILRERAREIAANVGPLARLVEFGSGSSRKTRLLLEELMRPASYVPIDISRDALLAAVRRLRREFPTLLVQPVCADYAHSLELPAPPRDLGRTLVFFPGSTIGNLLRDEAVRLMRRMRAIAGADGRVLIGLDLQKDPAVIERAYNDAAGVTAAFNLHLLARIQRDLDAVVDVDAFEHRAGYDRRAGRVEMQLVSRSAQEIRVGDEAFALAAGEPISTEYCHKYTVEGFRGMAGEAGLVVDRVWTDDDDLFAVALLRVGGKV